MITFLPLIYYLSLPSLSTLHYLSTGFTILFYSILFYFILYFSISTYFCTHYWFPFFSISTFPHPLSLSLPSPLVPPSFYCIASFYVLSYCFRIINVSSSAHNLGDLEAVRATNDLMLEKTGAYQPWPAYGNHTHFIPIFSPPWYNKNCLIRTLLLPLCSYAGNTKLANILFTRELAQRLKAKTPGGSDISTFTLHPGDWWNYYSALQHFTWLH